MRNNTKPLLYGIGFLLLAVIFILSCTQRANLLAPTLPDDEVSPEEKLDRVYVSLLEEKNYVPSSPDGYKVVCYLTLPGNNNSKTHLRPNNVAAKLCTHVIVGFASVVNCTLNLGRDIKFFEDAVALKSINSELKVMVSVGGMDEINTGFPVMTKNHANRKIFIRSVLKAIEKLRLDGVDIDWEFPGRFDVDGRQRIRYVQLLQEFKKAFNKNNRKLVLSAAVAASQTLIDLGYNIPQIAEHVDFVNLMSYDYRFYTSFLPLTGLNSPLFPSADESGAFSTLNVNFSSEYWADNGMPREKIIVGVPTYGHSYTLYNPKNHGLKAPSSGYGSLGNLGFVSYPIVCDFLANSATRVFENSSLVPYAFRGTEWISYDDIVSVTAKAHWIRSSGFGGAMIFSLNTDDWNATCDGKSSFPLTRAIIKIIGN